MRGRVRGRSRGHRGLAEKGLEANGGVGVVAETRVRGRSGGRRGPSGATGTQVSTGSGDLSSQRAAWWGEGHSPGGNRR